MPIATKKQKSPGSRWISYRAKPFLCISPHLFHITLLKLIHFHLLFKVGRVVIFHASRVHLTSISISHHTICLNTFTLLPWPPGWAEPGHTFLSSSCRITASKIRGPGQILLGYWPVLPKREGGFVVATWRLFYEILSQHIMNSFSAFWLFLLYSKPVPGKPFNLLGLTKGKELN